MVVNEDKFCEMDTNANRFSLLVRGSEYDANLLDCFWGVGGNIHKRMQEMFSCYIHLRPLIGCSITRNSDFEIEVVGSQNNVCGCVSHIERQLAEKRKIR